jgi:hypothetical protein
MRIIAASIIVAYLVSCSPPQAEPPPDPDAAEQVGEAEQLPQVLPPPSETTPRYVGQWAAASLGCEQPAWRFEERRVSTAGEVSCEFNDVQITPTGYTIQAACIAQAPPTQETIQLSFAESVWRPVVGADRAHVLRADRVALDSV